MKTTFCLHFSFYRKCEIVANSNLKPLKCDGKDNSRNLSFDASVPGKWQDKGKVALSDCFHDLS